MKPWTEEENQNGIVPLMLKCHCFFITHLNSFSLKPRDTVLILGSVWIELIFAETKNWNWKHYSKIIFKCVNSAIGPIFNEKNCWKVEFVGLWTVHRSLFTVEKSTFTAIVQWTVVALLPETREKRKKKEKENTKREFTNTHAASAQSKLAFSLNLPLS